MAHSLLSGQRCMRQAMRTLMLEKAAARAAGLAFRWYNSPAPGHAARGRVNDTWEVE
eukprot:CAMPEP_0195079870 /NCGR_PEP_ID=MMETSP0448-20130528/21712_1 /TAXON_ID=66468 /ORGANISM="Heterocapsa triquestra, Strain CCMP 448" /LENGTH=56 /DNA_ID=CAMNT_0040112761 /DNA_START=11 /DNA_END=178 /DNA_ORIENTATION=+